MADRNPLVEAIQFIATTLHTHDDVTEDGDPKNVTDALLEIAYAIRSVGASIGRISCAQIGHSFEGNNKWCTHCMEQNPTWKPGPEDGSGGCPSCAALNAAARKNELS